MKHDDYLKQVTSKLDHLAERPHDKAQVMNHVFAHIQQKKTSRYGLWKMSGFALAAAITGITILPYSNEITEPAVNQAVVSPKLSPQMVEDLEMLMVLGEDRGPHGS
jgi:hypothetical protein